MIVEEIDEEIVKQFKRIQRSSWPSWTRTRRTVGVPNEYLIFET